MNIGTHGMLETNLDAAEEQNFPPSGFGYFGYGVSHHHLNRNEPFQWHVGQHTRPLDGPIEFLSLAVYSPPF